MPQDDSPRILLSDSEQPVDEVALIASINEAKQNQADLLHLSRINPAQGRDQQVIDKMQNIKSMLHNSLQRNARSDSIERKIADMDKKAALLDNASLEFEKPVKNKESVKKEEPKRFSLLECLCPCFFKIKDTPSKEEENSLEEEPDMSLQTHDIVH